MRWIQNLMHFLNPSFFFVINSSIFVHRKLRRAHLYYVNKLDYASSAFNCLKTRTEVQVCKFNSFFFKIKNKKFRNNDRGESS